MRDVCLCGEINGDYVYCVDYMGLDMIISESRSNRTLAFRIYGKNIIIKCHKENEWNSPT